jgi:7-cyano-7-deazaguanine synthase
MSTALLLSGGLDSMVLLAREVLRNKRYPYCVAFDYGQRHRTELACAANIAQMYRCNLRIITLQLANRDSALTGGREVPKAHYADPVQSNTVVRNRNLLMLTYAASLPGIEKVLIACHAGDAPIYPDCRREFIEAASETLMASCGVSVEAPFLEMTKRDIVQLGRGIPVRFEMAWSCYEGGIKPCGKCGACVEREEAMKETELCS